MLSYTTALRVIFERMDMERGERPPYAERVWRLERVIELLSALGDPHLQYPAIHVAGTKGKGSTTAMIASALCAAGFRTGMYTSPHLHTFRERIQVDGQPIPEDALSRLVAQIKPVLETRPEVTVFEIITALAMLHFAEVGVDWAVFEVGLGGRLDATNVIKPRVAVITSISLDHMNVLGATISQIASEKAGIIKEGVPVISAPQRPKALAVIASKAAERHAPLTVGGRDWRWERLPDRARSIQVSRGQPPGKLLYPRVEVPLIGEHQRENALNAIMALETLREEGFELTRCAIARGIAQTHWPGRFEVLQSDPALVVDGAHNVDSMQKLLRTLQSEYPDKNTLVVFGAGRGHLPAELVRVLQGKVTRAYLTRANHPKASDVDGLMAAAHRLGLPATGTRSVAEAIEQALTSATREDVVLVTGSLFVVAEARRAWMRLNGLPEPPSDPPGSY